MQYKTEAEYLDEKNLGKPLIKSDNFEIYQLVIDYYEQKEKEVMFQQEEEEFEDRIGTGRKNSKNDGEENVER